MKIKLNYYILLVADEVLKEVFLSYLLLIVRLKMISSTCHRSTYNNDVMIRGLNISYF